MFQRSISLKILVIEIDGSHLTNSAGYSYTRQLSPQRRRLLECCYKLLGCVGVIGRRRKRWEDNIREWTGLEFAKSLRAVENREKWRKLVAKSSEVPQRPSWLRDR